MDEEKIDRRAHWAQLAITGIIIATAWCVKLEMTTGALKQAADDKAKTLDVRHDATVKRFEDLDQRITKLEKDMEWLKQEASNGKLSR